MQEVFYFRTMDESKNPWQIQAERAIYDNQWIQLTEFDVINPSGGPGIYGKVHFKNLAIGIVPLDEQMNTYLVGQYRFTLNRYSWEIPEGGGPLTIDPLESARRELLEETGLTADRWEKILDLDLSNSVTDETGYIYLARDLKEGMAQPEETEDLMVRKMPFSDAIRMVEEGKVTDSMSVAALLKVKLMIKDGRIS